MRIVSALVLLASVSLTPACGSGPDAAPPEGLTTQMHRHFAHAIALREVVVGGNLALLSTPAAELGRDAHHAALPPTATPFVERMNQAARRAGDARTLFDGAQSVAEVAAACGECHAAHQLQLTPSAPDTFSENADVRGHMQRHHWATGKLWDGLVRPSWEDWKRGADALSEAHLPAELLDGVDGSTAALAERLHAAGARAREASPGARPAIFGEILATCAGCHARRQPVE